MSMSELFPSGPGTPVTARPARCTCTGPVVETLAETLGCPRRWWPVPGGGWAHIWPPRRRAATATQTEVTIRGNKP